MINDSKHEHEIRLVKRESMSVYGVSDVTSFDESSVTLTSVEGELVIEGEDIKIGVLDTDKGIVTLSGRVDGFYYVNDNKNEKKGFFSKNRK